MNENKKYIGLSVIGFLILGTFGLWFFGDKTLSVNSLGQLAGLIGLVLFSCNIVLGSRIKFLEKYFYSQNKIYISHHLIGGITLITLIFHPILLSIKYLSSFKETLTFLVLGNSPAANFGAMALWLMILLLFITFFIKIDYKKWYFSHRLLGLVYVLIGIHWLTISSDVSSNMVLRLYILFIYLIGVLALIYKIVIPNLAIKKYKYFVSEKKLINGYLYLKLKSNDEKINYRPGQFVFLEAFGETHPFSLASVGEELELIIKTLGDWTNKLPNLEINEIVKIDGPYGKFGQGRNEGEEVWVAGGVGIVPFIGLAKERFNKKITLYYSVKKGSEIINKDEFKKIEMESDNFKVIFIESDTQGMLTADKILSENKDTQYLLCGPPAMVLSIKSGLLKLNVSPKVIISEEFNLK